MNKLVKLCLKTQDYYLLFKNKKHVCWNVQGSSKCWKYIGSMYRKQLVSVQQKNVFKSGEKCANVISGYTIVTIRLLFNPKFVLCM